MEAMIKRVIRWIPMTAFVCALVIVGSCSRSVNRPIDEHWIWAYVSRPDQSGDGFAQLYDAVQAHSACGALTESVLANVTHAANSLAWSGRPDMRHPIPLSEYAFASRLTSRRGSIEIDYEALIALCKDLSLQLDAHMERGDEQEVQKLSESMIRLGYQIARGQEEQVIGTLRIALWDSGFRARARIQAINPAQESEVLARLEHELSLIKNRDSNQLYNLDNRQTR